MAVLTLLSLVCIVRPGLPAGETIGQWVWFDKISILSAIFILLSFCFMSRRDMFPLDSTVSKSLILLGSVEAVWGICQLYGFTVSGHSLYALTGSFSNPGPYSGYLAIILPICLHQYLLCNENEKKLRQFPHDGYSWRRIIWRMKHIAVGSVIYLILCVLPAGMSRSAWLAAGVSCFWVYACHKEWRRKVSEIWQRHRMWSIIAIIGGLCVILLVGYLLFTLKPDSARGRLFMWKMACKAIVEHPWHGYGIGSFAAVYGDVQETYFSVGNYEVWEERVGGSPEYAFNEYLQVAMELGIPMALCLLMLVVICLYVGIRKGRFGICGAILSLMIFSFSSYPLQLPAFVITAVCLLFACILGGSRREWLGVAVLIGFIGSFRLKDNLYTEQACQEWMNVKSLYNARAYNAAEKEYYRLYPLLKKRGSFLFEYGHILHKLQKQEASNEILKEALKYSSDSMILNIIGKNCQQAGDYLAAEDWLMRSIYRLPGRIYPYYLLANLYAELGFYQPDKLKKVADIVLTKTPKAHSTAIEEMRSKVRKIVKEKIIKE
ncbi:O-antigen ligase domain-containing protein [Bacteroides oleiciplenus]|uniref:O-antigen ligase domain-containing protein n=2 Tax=Bacteroides oleiciplenus TaxID=626931 RepID=A0A3E5BEP0_9BACE|nr:O-antigen ligase family protein [Bacteroides oleiciplenus]RGN36058.1 O-antigen ligase domain-containing protein [Bacteroides oleiciplenus]